MLVLANGAFKSGSTWLRAVVGEMIEHEPIPKPYQDPFYPWMLDPVKLHRFIREVDYHSKNYISKTHLFTKGYRNLLLRYRNIYILDIKRDLRDVLVSHYHHLLRESKIKVDFEQYYWTIGRYKAYQIYQYHKVWEINSPQVLIVSFERLKLNFEEELLKIGHHLGIKLSLQDIKRIYEATSIEKMREKWKETEKPEDQRFFRGGRIGDWKDYLTQEMLEDLQRITTVGLRVPEQFKYWTLFVLRPQVKIYLRSYVPKLYSIIHKRW